METTKQDIPDTLWVGIGRKDAPITRDETRFLKYFHSWMLPFKFKVKHVEFWPGFAWGTIRMESPEARNILLKHVIDKPFRPDGESGWVLNKFEKCVPVYPESPKKSPAKTNVALAKKRSSVADNLLQSSALKEKASSSKTRGRKSRSSTASPATIVDNSQVADLEELERNHASASFEEEEDDSELRVKATIAKLYSSLKLVEAVTKKHGVYKLSISDIVGASKYKPTDLTGAIIVIVLGPLKKNQRRRDFLRAELSDEWTGPPMTSASVSSIEEPTEEQSVIKEEALENALVNLKKFYKWSIKDEKESQRQIAALLEEVANADSIQDKIAIISDHLTLASQSFSGIDLDDDSIEELITSTRCSSAFSDVKRQVGSVDYDRESTSHLDEGPSFRRTDIIVDKEDKISNMQDFVPTEHDAYEPKNILNLSDSPVPMISKKSRQASGAAKESSSGGGKNAKNSSNVFDLPTSRQTIKANASSYTVESSAEIHIDMMYWQKMLQWLTIHHFDHHGDHAKDHAKWVVIVWELSGITPTNLKSEIVGHQQTVANFCNRLAEMLEVKRAKIPFWKNLSISNVIHATLCYLLSKNFPAESVPRCLTKLFSTVPYINSKTGSVYQMRGYVDKYISDEKGLLMSPKGYVLFNSYSIIGMRNSGDESEESLTVPLGTQVLFNAVKVEETIDDGKRYKYYVATNVWMEPDFQVYYDDLAKQVNLLQTSAMAKVLHRANSNLSDEAILSMYEDGLSKVAKAAGKIDLKNLLVDKATMDSLQPLVDFLRTRLELRQEMASNMSLMYASMWARIGYDLDYLREDFFTLNAIGARGCVTYNWEKLWLHFKLPNCLEMGHLVRETLAFLTTTSEAKYAPVDLVDGKSLTELSIKRARVDRHHQLLAGNFDDGSLWIPQPFQRTRLLEAILRPPSHGQIDAQEKADEHSKHNGVSILKMDEIKVRPEGEQTLTFESNGDGSLDADLVDAIIKGTIAFKYRIKDNVWRIISKSGDIFPRPPDGWGDREYIPIKRQVTPPGT